MSSKDVIDRNNLTILKNPLVSIIIPVFNSQESLAETIESALAQTWPNKEIIIVDDGSSDKSLDVAKGFKNPAIKIFEQENKGASAARNKGLAEAKGEYIQFLDADDLLNSIKIEDQLRLLKEKPGAISNCATIHYFDKSDPYLNQHAHEWYSEGSTNGVQFLTRLYGGSLIGPAYGGMIAIHAWLCPKAIIEKAGKWNEELSADDDGEFFCRVILASNEIIYSDKSLCYYRKYVQKKSLSTANNYDANKSLLKSNDLKAEHLLEKTTDAKTKLALSRLYWTLVVSFYTKYKDLAEEAEAKAMQLAPEYEFNPYGSGIKQMLSKLFGWKFIAFALYFKNKVRS
jgi:glycosyltransferase involved in cell wall biosynthesis